MIGWYMDTYLCTGAYMSYQSSYSHLLPETSDDKTLTHDTHITHDYDAHAWTPDGKFLD